MKSILLSLCALWLLALAAPARADWKEIYTKWGPLTDFSMAAEPNPGGTVKSEANDSDVGIVNLDAYSEVTANRNRRHVYINAIANKKCTDTTPDGASIALKSYKYVYAVRLPRIPVASKSMPWNAEAVHQMIQFWDGSDKLWTANKTTLEAAVFWVLNPWRPDVGKVYVYTDNKGALQLYDTGITLKPDTDWHVFDIRADLKNQVYAGIAIDQQWRPLAGIALAKVHHSTWGNDLSLILTAESMNAFPGANLDYVNEWTTQFKDIKLYRLD